MSVVFYNYMGEEKMFGLNLKYIIIIILLALIAFSIVKKLFKLAITVGILIVLYYLYTIFIK